MSDVAAGACPAKARLWVWLTVILGVLLLISVNVHLVYVAVMSQPDCVAHARSGEADGTHAFGAAKSSCTPTRTK
jgi:hypothetical protein